MARTCTICAHKKREQIDQALANGEDLRGIARKFRVSEDALTRHKKKHLPELLKESAHAETVTRADDLFSEIDKYKKRLDETIELAERKGDFKACMTGFRAVLDYLEFLSKIKGQMPPESQVNVQVVLEQHNQQTILLVDQFVGIIERISEKCPEVKPFATEELRKLKETATTAGSQADQHQ